MRFIHRYIEGIKQPGINWSWNKHDITLIILIGRFGLYYRRRRKYGLFGHNPQRTIFGINWVKGVQ